MEFTSQQLAILAAVVVAYPLGWQIVRVIAARFGWDIPTWFTQSTVVVVAAGLAYAFVNPVFAVFPLPFAFTFDYFVAIVAWGQAVWLTVGAIWVEVKLIYVYLWKKIFETEAPPLPFLKEFSSKAIEAAAKR